MFQIKTCLVGCLKLISVLPRNVPVDTFQPPGLVDLAKDIVNLTCILHVELVLKAVS